MSKQFLKQYSNKAHGNNEDNRIVRSYEMEENVSGSQNFCLRLSLGSSIEDTNSTENKKEQDDNDVIVISDSSSDSSHKFNAGLKCKIDKSFIRNNKVYVLESSDSECTISEDETFFESWKQNKKTEINKVIEEKARRNFIERNSAVYTSDETSCSSGEKNKIFVSNSSNKTSSTHVSLTPQIAEYGARGANQIPQNHTKCISETNVSSGRSNSSDGSSIINPTNARTPRTDYLHKTNSTKTHLTKRDIHNIYKNIKSTRAVYESPRAHGQQNVIIDETLDDDIHPAILDCKDDFRRKNQIIDETPISSENEVAQDPQVNLSNPYKNHVSRFLNAPDVDKTCPELSERKKKQISTWLMTTSPESKSDSSFSHVPPSNRSSLSSGNSSLERLEMNYETPNNRGKLPKSRTSEKQATIRDTDAIVHSVISRQATLDAFVRKPGNETLKLQTPKVPHVNVNSKKSNQSTANSEQNVDIMECADILDKLYGNVWRSKADALLPVSEPRKQVVSTRNRAVQTERKPTNKGKYRVILSDTEDSDTSMRNLKPQFNSTKKSVRKNRPRDSFINEDSSESESESLYHTALTNPRVSTNTDAPKATPISAIARRVVAICDSDTDDQDNNRNTDHVRDVGRRRLSFSNDEDEDSSAERQNSSSTSEFDPGDHIPPKVIFRKETTKTPKQTPKPTVRNETHSAVNQKPAKQNSFLASLSESVPIGCAHPDAKKYRLNFKNTKDELCRHLFKLYNESVFDKKLPEDMSIEWNVRMRGTAGFCYNKKSVRALTGIMKSSRIVLATKILDTPDRLRDTLIHEMCHAAAWLINDVSDGHGPFWTGWANKAMKTFPELPPIRRCHDYKIKTKFTYKCTGCGYSIGRHSKSLDVERKRCGHCYGKFELLINKTTKSGTVQMQTPKREPSAFALYVKQNYNSVKKERNAKHAEVMKILGQQFSAVKIAKTRGNDLENDPDTPL